jgi:hypothetical protein
MSADRPSHVGEFVCEDGVEGIGRPFGPAGRQQHLRPPETRDQKHGNISRFTDTGERSGRGASQQSMQLDPTGRMTQGCDHDSRDVPCMN